MTASNLQDLLMKHNRRAMLLTIMLAGSCILLWWLSYVLTFQLTEAIYRLYLRNYVSTWVPSALVALFMLLLVGEIWRQRSGLFDLKEFHGWGFRSEPHGSDLAFLVGLHPRFHVGSATATAWMVLQILLLAPHTTMLAVRHWRSRVKLDAEVLNRAVALYESLAKVKDWVQIKRKRLQRELAYLDRAGLLWSRREGKLLEVQTFHYEPAVSWWDEMAKSRRGKRIKK